MKKCVWVVLLSLHVMPLHAVNLKKVFQSIAEKMTYRLQVDDVQTIQSIQQQQRDGELKRLENALCQMISQIAISELVPNIKALFDEALQLQLSFNERTVFSDELTVLEKLIIHKRYKSALKLLLTFPAARIRNKTFHILVSIPAEHYSQDALGRLFLTCYQRAAGINFDVILTEAFKKNNAYIRIFLLREGFQIVDVKGCVEECKKNMPITFANNADVADAKITMGYLVYLGYIFLTHCPDLFGDYLKIDINRSKQSITIVGYTLPGITQIGTKTFNTYEHSLAYWIRACASKGSELATLRPFIKKIIIQKQKEGLLGDASCAIIHFVGTLNDDNKELILNFIVTYVHDIYVRSEIIKALKRRWICCDDNAALWLYKQLENEPWKIFHENAFTDVRFA